MRQEVLENDRTTISDQGKGTIQEQLDRLLGSPYFSQSRRSVNFLRFVVDHALSGETEALKERTLGIEIFGRDAGYDTASDPCVRVTASEVRKRIAQYYQESEHEDELRITLPAGAYVPEFHWHKTAGDDRLHSEDHAVDAQQTKTTVELAPEHPVERLIEPSLHPFDLTFVSGESAQEVGVHTEAEGKRPRRRLTLKRSLACVIVGFLSVAGAIIFGTAHHSTFDFFWRPVLATNDPILFCISDQLQTSGIALRNPSDPASAIWLPDPMQKNSFATVTFDDLKASLNIASIFESQGKQFSVRGEGSTNLADLRSGPSVFIGAFDNPWTLRMTNSLRFHFSSDATMTHLSIVDSKAPTRDGWAADRTVQLSRGEYRDFAIVARYTDSDTGKLVVIIAGIGGGGTLAASQFLTDSSSLSQLERAAKADGDKKNMELVLSTTVIDAQPGAPKIEAAYFW